MTIDNPASSEHTPIANQPALGGGSQQLQRVQHPHATRFRVVSAVLFGIAVAAIAIAVVAAARSGGAKSALASGARWSSWAPGTSGSTGVSEIAQHTSPYYRISAAHQLDVVTPIQLAQITAAGTTTGSGVTVAINQSTSSKSQSLGLLNGKTVAYNICGLGAKDCELAGTPTINRMLLLRREGLELALYTFKYIGGAQNVVVVLPPGHTVTSSGTTTKGVTVALVFLRSELQYWLNVPLSKTLQQYPPAVSQLSAWSKTQEAGFVDQVTAHGLFSSQIQSQQEGGNLLVLTPLPAQ
ncbi:MAG: hypothetical protein KGL15_04215 [Acidobacteriota bacterium]|nr:hypothetical protein [Acidobacteriota bacterium]